MKCVLTVIGKDKPGIIYKVSELLAKSRIHIEDITQTIMQSTFTMVMIVNLEKSTISFKDLSEKVNALSAEIGVRIHLQNEDIFDAIYKV